MKKHFKVTPLEDASSTAAETIKAMLKAAIDDDIKITIIRDDCFPGTVRIAFEGKNHGYSTLVNHLDIDFSLATVTHVSEIITSRLQSLVQKERMVKHNDKKTTESKS